jgi:hypothetical protein
MRSYAIAALAATAVAASDPLCAKGLKASDGSITVCCPKACGGCGGASCATFPGGASKCCVGKIIAAQTSGYSRVRAMRKLCSGLRIENFSPAGPY